MITGIGTDTALAAALLRANQIVAVPTETVYGLAGNALSEKAIAKIYEAKNRPQFNPLIMHLPDVSFIKEYAVLNDTEEKMLHKLMPGPFTVLLKKKENVPDLLTAGSSRVAVRVPSHPVMRELLFMTDFPLAAPSANPSGYISPVTAEDVATGLDGKVAYILDGGPCDVGIESTIGEFAEDRIILHRLGGMSAEKIEEVTGLKTVVQTQHDKPTTSGQLKSHYAPHTPLYMGNVQKRLDEFAGKNIAVISFSEHYRGTHITSFILSEKRDYTEAASKLFRTLRDVDLGKFDVIVAEEFPEENLGPAINDRLNRAQAMFKK